MSKPKKIWDNYVVVKEVQKNERLKFVIAAATRDGYRCLNIREFYLKKTENIWKPGRDGIIIPLKAPRNRLKKGVVPVEFTYPMDDLMEALPVAIEFASNMPLSDPDNEVWYPAKEESNED